MILRRRQPAPNGREASGRPAASVTPPDLMGASEELLASANAGPIAAQWGRGGQ